MTVVIGTAGHIDHGKTALLRALTGIDADRLPEERRRGMTIEVGYAHLGLPDGDVLDFVDVPGHDRLVGNMLVGAGEIDAVLLVVALDDGPRAQTLEHLELLDGLGLRHGLVAITKADLAPPDDPRRVAVAAAARDLLAGTSLAGSPILVVSALTGVGLDDLRSALVALRDRVVVDPTASRPAGGASLAIDRAFAVRGRGAVVTGSLRGGTIRAGDRLRLEPGGREVRIREVQARGQVVDASIGGRTALNLAGITADELARGQVLTVDPGVVGSARWLVALRPPARLRRAVVASLPKDGERLRLHAGTAQVDATLVRRGREAIELDDGGLVSAILRLAGPVAAAPGDVFVLRRSAAGELAAAGRLLETQPARGISRRRATPARLIELAAAVAAPGPESGRVATARLELGGAVAAGDGEVRVAADLRAALDATALDLVAEHHRAAPLSPGLALAELRPALAAVVRQRVTLDRATAARLAGMVVDGLVADGRLARDADRVRDPARAAGLPPALAAAMDRLEAALSVTAPPPLAEAARAAGCPPDGVRALEAAGRLIRVDADLAWSATTYRDLEALAVGLARRAPLAPAALRDATGASRRYVLPLLEDLDRRGILERTAAGHVPGPRAPR